MALKIQDPHAVLVLLDEKGMTCFSVAEILDNFDGQKMLDMITGSMLSSCCPSERTIRYWVKRFNEEGLAGLVEVEHPGRPSRISDKQMQRIDQALREPPEKVGMIGNVWAGKILSAFIAKEFGVEMGVRQCQGFFRHLGYRLRKPRSQVDQADPKRKRLLKNQLRRLCMIA